MFFRRFALVLAIAGASFSAGDPDPVAGAADRLEERARQCAAGMAGEFRMLGALALQPRHPALARKFVDVTFEELGSGTGLKPSPQVIGALAAVAPADAIAILPKISPSSTPMLVAALGREKSPEAGRLFEQVVSTYSFENLDPRDAWQLFGLAGSVASVAPLQAASAYERIVTAVSPLEYGEQAKSKITATFQIGSETITTGNSRDTLLIAAGARLKALAPERAAKFQSLLGRWKLSEVVDVRGINFGSTPSAASTATPPEVSAIREKIGRFRGMATDAERAKAALEVSAALRALPGAEMRLNLVRGLCNLSTEGDLGKEALSTVAATLGYAMKQASPTISDYITLAKYVRYEQVPAPFAEAPLDAAQALLALREAIQEGNGFTLTALDGKEYSLASLRGKVVLLNFWATWCPPCRKEMPDMEKLSRVFAKDGLVVLAISHEDRATVEGFLKKQPYTFPVLLDPQRQVHSAFQVEGIPKSFLFDREGKLVAQAIDMRTERQFREMLKKAGLE